MSDAVICNDVTEATPLCQSPIDTAAYFATENDNIVQIENCPICFEDFSSDNHPNEPICSATSPHVLPPCSTCLLRYFKTALMDYRIISCPMCEHDINYNLLKNIMEQNHELQDFHKYDSRLVEQYLKRDPEAKFCPHPDCPYVAIIPDCKKCPKLLCPRCLTLFCGICQKDWHQNQKCKRTQNLDNLPPNIKSCPNCGTCIEKLDDGSCNLISCQICQKKFCWLCGKEASEIHFWSPSGCTYFGYNRWNRRHTNYCQLCILLTAPLIVVLVTLFAFFAILIGLPILVGYLLTSKLVWEFRIVKYTIIPIVVTLMVILGPLIYIIFVILAVPLMYLFFYLIMPIYLCKKGLCCSCRDRFRDQEEAI
ncbi:hypothetical protein LOD99_3747 [Oopsacas minuta]|uniref:RBR-type E3 ubiquitin transferase n=1 Tax=Oopsacas minuta TaxID=111878 RepID=A0AAV7JW91_9METZ|nr:hypothetical protein LOD99_3747 [Oopsacas minuta]